MNNNHTEIDDGTAVDAPPDKLEIRAGGTPALVFDSPGPTGLYEASGGATKYCIDGENVSAEDYHRWLGAPGHDPRNHFGRHFYPEGYAGNYTLFQSSKGWAHKIRRKIAKRFGIT